MTSPWWLVVGAVISISVITKGNCQSNYRVTERLCHNSISGFCKYSNKKIGFVKVESQQPFGSAAKLR
jgi:hypothetical protein